MYLTIYLVQTEWTALRSVRPSTQLVMFQLQIQLKVRPRYKTNFISISQQQIMQPPLSISNNTKEMSKVNLLQYWDIKEVITLFLRTYPMKLVVHISHPRTNRHSQVWSQLKMHGVGTWIISKVANQQKVNPYMWFTRSRLSMTSLKLSKKKEKICL